MKKTFLALALLIAPAAHLGAQSSWGTDVGVSVMFPTGQSSEAFSMGWGAMLGAHFALDKSTFFTVNAGYFRSGLDEAGLNQALADEGWLGTVSVDGSVSAIPLLIGVKFVPTKQGFKVYALFEGGVYMYSKEASGTFTEADGTGGAFPAVDEFRSEPGFNAGLGFQFPLNPTTWWDVAFRYHWVKDSRYSNYTSGGGTTTYVSVGQWFSITFGISTSNLFE